MVPALEALVTVGMATLNVQVVTECTTAGSQVCRFLLGFICL